MPSTLASSSKMSILILLLSSLPVFCSRAVFVYVSRYVGKYVSKHDIIYSASPTKNSRGNRYACNRIMPTPRYFRYRRIENTGRYRPVRASLWHCRALIPKSRNAARHRYLIYYTRFDGVTSMAVHKLAEVSRSKCKVCVLARLDIQHGVALRLVLAWLDVGLDQPKLLYAEPG